MFCESSKTKNYCRFVPVKVDEKSKILEHVSYASKKLLIKQKTLSTWCVLLWKDYVRVQKLKIIASVKFDEKSKIDNSI